MLIEFFGRNFGCFRDEFRLSMLATDIDPDNPRGVMEVQVEGDPEPLRLLRAVAIYGPNASGKSTVIEGAGALGQLIARSGQLQSDEDIPVYVPFALGPERSKPVHLGATCVIDSRVYAYEVAFDLRGFHEEKLAQLSSEGERLSLIDRRDQKAGGKWADDGRIALLMKDFRRNALLLSLADQFAPAIAKNIAVGIRRLLSPASPFPFMWQVSHPGHVAAQVEESPPFKQWLIERVARADLGVADVQTRDVQRLRAPRRGGDERAFDGPPPRAETVKELELLHHSAEGPVALPYKTESLGTRRLILLAPVFYGLTYASDPRAFFYDELDASLHPVLLRSLLEEFNGGPLESVKGQLVFTAHETSLMDDEAKYSVLRRDQIYFTEKDGSGAARLYSLAEFKERNNLNLRRRYLQGRYGALPAVSSMPE